MLMYSAIKNITPQSLIAKQLGTGVGVPISGPPTPVQPLKAITAPLVTLYDSVTGFINGVAKPRDPITQGTNGYQNSPKTRLVQGGR